MTWYPHSPSPAPSTHTPRPHHAHHAHHSHHTHLSHLSHHSHYSHHSHHSHHAHHARLASQLHPSPALLFDSLLLNVRAGGCSGVVESEDAALFFCCFFRLSPHFSCRHGYLPSRLATL